MSSACAEEDPSRIPQREVRHSNGCLKFETWLCFRCLGVLMQSLLSSLKLVPSVKGKGFPLAGNRTEWHLRGKRRWKCERAHHRIEYHWQTSEYSPGPSQGLIERTDCRLQAHDDYRLVFRVATTGASSLRRCHESPNRLERIHFGTRSVRCAFELGDDLTLASLDPMARDSLLPRSVVLR